MSQSQRVLNPEQKQAIAHDGGPMLVRAGAGTGKTTVLVERIARLILEERATPEQIVATTYTIKAAAEIARRVRERVEPELGPGSADGLRIKTFHAWCEEVLQKNKAAFELILDEQLWVFLRQQIDARRLPLNIFQKAVNPAKFLGDFIQFISRCNDEVVDAKRYRNYVNTLRDTDADLPRMYRTKEAESISREEIIARCEEVADVFEYVERMLAEKKMGTFGLLILRAIELLKHDPAVRSLECDRTKFILIDEFQDSNVAQLEFASLLAGKPQNIFAVGDPDQAIYRFRGASSAAFQQFMERFPQAKTVTLSENHRSTQNILDCAYSVIKLNTENEFSGYARKPLVSSRKDKPEKVTIVCDKGPEHEAADAAAQIQAVAGAGTPLSECAVLYRAHGHSTEVIHELEARQLPYTIIGTDLLQTETLREVVAFLRTLDSATDNVSLFKLALMPRYGIDLEKLTVGLNNAGRNGSVAGVLQNMAAGKRLLREIADIRKKCPPESAEVPEVLLAVTKLLEVDTESVEMKKFQGFVANWMKLSFTTSALLGPFLRYLEYYEEANGKLVIREEEQEDANAVRLMTVHGAKGLEFKHVWVLRSVSGAFPTNYRSVLFQFPEALRSSREIELADDKEAHADEERRLFYVAMTRAKDSLALHGKSRGKDRIPPGYMRELSFDKTLATKMSIRDAEYRIASIAASRNGDGPAQGALFGTRPVRPLSASSIDKYETCPQQFKFQYEWRIPEGAGAALQYGAAIHRVLHEFYKSVAAKRPHSEEQIIEMFRRELEASRMGDPLQNELYERQGVVQLKRFFSGSARTEPEVLATEFGFDVTIEDVQVRGRIDRVDRVSADGTRILDYKTGNPKRDDDARKSLQLAIYALAAKEKWGTLPEKVAFHNLDDDTIVEATLTEKNLEKVRERIRDAANGIAAGNFEPKPGFHCKFCAYYILCSATAEKLYTIQPVAAATSA